MVLIWSSSPVGIGPDIGPRLGVVGGLPDAIDVVDISDNVDRRIALPGSRRAEPEGEDVENVGNGRPGRAAIGRTIKRFICRRGAERARRSSGIEKVAGLAWDGHERRIVACE